MKNYKKADKQKKYSGKLLQIRLADEEYLAVNDFIKRFGKTKREWVLAVRDYLSAKHLLKDGAFYYDWKDYAYANSDQWDRKIDEDSVCEICGCEYTHQDHAKYHQLRLERHHYAGYEGENAFKTIILCRPCHGKARSDKKFFVEINRKLKQK